MSQRKVKSTSLATNLHNTEERVGLFNKTVPNKRDSETGVIGRVGRLCLGLHLLLSMMGRATDSDMSV